MTVPSPGCLVVNCIPTHNYYYYYFFLYGVSNFDDHFQFYDTAYIPYTINNSRTECSVLYMCMCVSHAGDAYLPFLYLLFVILSNKSRVTKLVCPVSHQLHSSRQHDTYSVHGHSCIINMPCMCNILLCV